MENDQLVKRVEWLDKERIGDKTTISELMERVEQLENTLDKSTEYATGLNSEINRLNIIVEKVDKFESTLSNFSKDVKKELDAHDKQRQKREEESRKSHRIEHDEISNKLLEFLDDLKTIETAKADIKARKSEEKRLGKAISKISNSLETVRNSEDDSKRLLKSMTETQQKEAKRIADLQAEGASLRKRLDKNDGRMELVLSDQRKTEVRLNEIEATEKERRESQAAFIEEIIGNQNDRNQKWEDWNKRFDTIEEQSKQLASHLKNISKIERAVQKAQGTFDDITEKLGRRINEITEMQRLGEERIRQEFANFKADDQKRWTNFMLTQEELQKESYRELEKLIGQSSNLEDTVQEMQDVLQHLSDQTERRLQTTLDNMREWVNENENFLGSMR